MAEHPDGERWTVAKREAEAWAAHVATGGVTAPTSIADACEAYAKHVRANKGEKAAADVERRLQQYVIDDPRFAATELTKLTPAAIGVANTTCSKARIQRRPWGNAVPAVLTET